MSYVINSAGCSCRKRRCACCSCANGSTLAAQTAYPSGCSCMCPNGCPGPRVRNVVYTGPCPPAPDDPCQPPLPPPPPDPPCYRPLVYSACCNGEND